jgi:hypothetical protein
MMWTLQCGWKTTCAWRNCSPATAGGMRRSQARTGSRRTDADAVKLEVAFLAHSDCGRVYTPLRDGVRGDWPEGAFGDDVGTLEDVSASVVSLSALRADKAAERDDPIVAAKDQADLQTLSRTDAR